MASSPSETNVVSVLSYVDSHMPIRNCSTLVSYVLDLDVLTAVEPERLKKAAERVARKWRLFAGRPVWDEGLSRWTIAQPTGDLAPERELVRLSNATHDARSHVTFVKHTSTSCRGMSLLPESDFLSPGTIHEIGLIAEANSPLVSLHLATYADVQCIGVSINHAILDAHGFGTFLRALNAELHELPWKAAPLETSNKLDAAVERVARESARHPDISPASSLSPTGMGCGATLLNWWTLKKLEWAEWIDEWFGTERAAVFVGREIADALIAQVKEEVKLLTEGREFVSTGDILQAWLLKAAYSNEWYHTPLRTTHILELRTLLHFDSPHPSTWMYLLPNWPSPTRASVATLALHHRRRLTEIRTPQKASAFLLWIYSFAERAVRPLHATVGLNSFIFTNQCASGLGTAIDFGAGQGKGYQVLAGLAPGGGDSFAINQVGEGYTFAGVMRKSRWASVRRELAKLRAEHGGAKRGLESVQI